MITFVVSLLNHSIGIYEVRNTGWPYNLGFMIGAMSALGGAGANAKQRNCWH